MNESLAIESKDLSEEKERLKAYICRKQGIKLLKLPYKANEGEIEYIRKIKKVRFPRQKAQNTSLYTL